MVSIDDNLLGVTNADQEVYRVYRKEYLLETFRTGADVLVTPKKWEDPFENFFLTRTQVCDASGALGSLEPLADGWFGQCWTTLVETDAMWRIYSPCKTGLKVRTTIRKLFDNLVASASNPSLQAFAGSVTYKNEQEIISWAGSLTFTNVALGGQATPFAELFCVKREAFAHEAEVRLLYQEIAGTTHVSNPLHAYRFDANVLLNEVVIDPRCSDAEAAMIEDELQRSGCQLPVTRSELYRAPSFIIEL